jgi:Family of unknown function (DUF6297)
MTVTAAPVSTAKIAAVRSFIRGKRRRPWYDWYAIGFAIALAAFMLSDFLAAPFNRLLTSGSTAPAQAQAGAALVIAAGAGLVMLAQLLGPLALSPADASWLLLSPLGRRDVLRRPAITAMVVSALTGAVLGVLALTMAGPYLKHGARNSLWAWLLPAAIGGAGFFLAATLVAMLAQPSPRWRARLRVVCAVVSLAAALGALSGERWVAVPRRVTAVFADVSIRTTDLIAAVAVAVAGVVTVLVWLMLPRFPANVARTDSARAGTTRLAASFLNVPLLTWIAEDSHWRGRLLQPRPWPQNLSSASFALAWVDWRRLSRRPALLLALAGSTLAPAVAGAALTGHARGYGIAAVLIGGAIAAGVQGTAATRRDTSDPALFRLLGVDPQAALRARAVLPALLSTCWLLVASAVLVLSGVLTGWLWPLLGLTAGPGLAAAALRIARTGSVNPGEQGPDSPLGPIPPWLISRVISLLLGAVTCYPLLLAVHTGHVHVTAIAAQLAVSAAVLAGFFLVNRAART